MYDSGSYAGLYFSGSNSALSIYVSYINEYWGLWKTIINPSRVQYSGSIYKTYIEFPRIVLGRYLKLYAVDGPLKDVVGNLIQFTEIEVEEDVSNKIISGSIYDKYGIQTGIPENVTETEIPT